MNKRLVGTGLAIGLVAGAGAGLVIELAGNANALSGAPAAVVAAVGDSTTDTAATDDGARPDPSARLQDVLQPLVDDGTITQAQADKVIAAVVAARPMGGHDGGPMGRGHRGPGGPGGLIGQGLDVVATTLGVTTDEVRTALQSGQSVADLAVSKGKTAQDVIDALVNEATTKINDKVTAGDMTQAQADQLIAGLTTGITAFVNGTAPGGMPGFGPGFGGPFGMGHHGNDNDADDDAPGVVPATPATTDTVAG
jgi:polyhydroxyalkanoate synthesis regulator phasin